MENASKALLIAGAVLLVIALIGIGMYILNSTSGVQDQATQTMSQLEIQNFNQKFEKYVSTKTTSSNAKAIIQEVNANNATSDKTVTLDTSGKTSINDINRAKKYSISTSDTNSDGIVDTVKVTEL